MYVQRNALDSLIHSAVKFLPNEAYSNNPDALKLDTILTNLVTESALIATSASVDPCNLELVKFIQVSSELLGNRGVRPIVRSKLVLILSNLCLLNISLRKSVANNVRVCQSIYNCLELTIDERLGPQNKIDILRLIQMLTYEKIEFADWLHKLMPLIIGDILCISSSELLPYSMCILCNLVCQSKIFTNDLKQKEFYGSLRTRILQLLSHNSKAVVISSLMLVGYLDDSTRDTVYGSQNLSQTFLCIFNILNTSSPDVLMTTHIAIDLLRKLVIYQQKSPNDPPILNHTAQNLTSYSFFEKSIQNLTSLLNILDPRSEESAKILNLLLSFCQIDTLKVPISLAITIIGPTEVKLTTPIYALLRIADLSFEEAIFPEIPLTSLRLLTIIIREAINAGRSIRSIFLPINPLLMLVKETFNEPRIQPSSQLAPFKANRIAEGLKLAEALTNDEEIRFELLEFITAQQCSSIFEQQMDSNPVTYTILPPNSSTSNHVLNHCADYPSTSSLSKGANLPLWSINAVSIPIQLMRLLASFKDYSKPHKELYWRLLKDIRLLPFLAFAIARGDHELIYDAFVLLTHCAQIHEFPLKILSNLTSKCASLRKTKFNANNKCRNKSDSFSSPEISYEKINGAGERENNRVEELTQLIAALQTKLARKQEKEQELEKMLLQQQGTRENIQHFVGDLEKCVVNSEAREKTLNLEKEKLVQKLEQLQNILETERRRAEIAEKEKKLMAEENAKERAVHSILRGKFDEMTTKFDTAAKAAFEKQVELEKLANQHKSQTDRMTEIEQDLQIKIKEIEDMKKIMAEQKSSLDMNERKIAKLNAQNQHLIELKESMAKLLGQFGQPNY